MDFHVGDRLRHRQVGIEGQAAEASVALDQPVDLGLEVGPQPVLQSYVRDAVSGSALSRLEST